MSSSPTVVAPQTDELVFLIGRPPMSEFIGYVSTQTVDGGSANPAELAARWRAANDHIRELEAKEAGLADAVPVTPVDKALESLGATVLADPGFARAYGMIPASLAVVELDRLIVFQKQINLSYAQSLAQSLSRPPSPEEVFRFCFSIDQPPPPVRAGRVGGNQFVFLSPSTDFRILDATIFQATEVSGHEFQRPVSAVVGLAVGYGPNFLDVVEAEGRLILNNGSHRAYALRSASVTHAPCVLQRISRREELEFVGSPDLQAKPDQFLTAPRPPLLKDYFDPKLRSVLRVPRRSRQVKVTIVPEVTDVPIG